MATRRSYEAAISVTAYISLVVVSGCAAPGICTRAGENPLLPPPREEPVWRDGQRKAGYAVWSADCTVPFFENLPPLAKHLVALPDGELLPGKTVPFFGKPTAGQLAGIPRCVSAAGGYEPLIIGVWALRDRGMVRLSSPKSRFKVKVTHVLFQERVVPPPPAKGGRRLGIPFYLPEEEEARLRSGRNTVWWLTIHIPPDTKPGVYREKLLLGFQEVRRVFNGSAQDTAAARGRYGYIEIPYTVEVLPFKVPRSRLAFGMYCLTFRCGGYDTKEYQQMYFEDMAAHGHTSDFFGSGGDDFGFLKTGKIKLAGSVFEQRLEARQKAGLIHKDIPIMFAGHGSHDYPGRFTEFARELRKACAERGWPELLTYGPDEPGMKDLEKCGQALLDVQSEMRTVTAMKGQFPEVGKHFSVWVVLSRLFSPEIARLAKEMERELWTYDCYHRGTNPTYNRYFAGLYTWAHRFKGNFVWAYAHTPECNWEGDRTDHRGHISPSKAGPVSMVGWEARREGIEDCRTLNYLEELIAGQAGDPVAGQASRWLADLRKRVNWRICADQKGALLWTNVSPLCDPPWSLYWWDITDLYDPSRRIDEKGNISEPLIDPHEYRSIRERAQGYIAKLLKKSG